MTKDSYRWFPGVAPWLTAVRAVLTVVEPDGRGETSNTVFVLPTARTVTSVSPQKCNEATLN